MPNWITLRTPEEGWVRNGRAPLDAATTDALVRAGRGVRARPPRLLVELSSHIYVVLLEYEEAKYGLYVGMTGRSPGERYRQDRAG